MAYVECVRCGLTAYSAARWSSIDYCARCGTPLPRGGAIVTPISRHPRFRPERTPPTGPAAAAGRPSAS
jgi:hypothetical protein